MIDFNVNLDGSEFSAEYVIDIMLNGRVASMGASGGSTTELSPLTDHAKNGWYRSG